MTGRGVFWVSIALIALVGAGCGASPDASDGHATATSRSTTTVAPTTTTTVPPPYSFDGSVPPPNLINTGTDYEAIYRSLDDYARWIEAHRPEAALAGEVYVDGTPTKQGFEGDLSVLRERRWRLTDVAKTVDVEVVQVKGSIASLRVIEHIKRLEARDGSGNVVTSQDFPNALEWLVLLSRDSEGRWRIASVDSKAPAT